MPLDFVDQEVTRRNAARQAWIQWRMQDLPAVYQALMPVSYKAKELLTAEKAIRAQAKNDAEILSSPWIRVGVRSNLIDDQGMSATERLALGIGNDRMLGMPDVVKRGFENHPEVIAAQELAHRTAEYVAHVQEKRAQRAMEDASHEYVRLANSGDADAAAVEAAKQKNDQRVEAHAAAEKEYTRLRKSRAAGMKIVREALSDEEIRAEFDSYERKPIGR